MNIVIIFLHSPSCTICISHSHKTMIQVPGGGCTRDVINKGLLRKNGGLPRKRKFSELDLASEELEK